MLWWKNKKLDKLIKRIFFKIITYLILSTGIFLWFKQNKAVSIRIFWIILHSPNSMQVIKDIEFVWHIIAYSQIVSVTSSANDFVTMTTLKNFDFAYQIFKENFSQNLKERHI